MTEDVRCLFRPGVEPPGRGGGAPQGMSKSAQEVKRDLAEFLDYRMARPLLMGDQARAEQIEATLGGLTMSERVLLELEIDERKRGTYSSDYDPLRP